MKKRSFFERLAGNLRFDDVDDELDEIYEPKRVPMQPTTPARQPEQRQLSVSKEGNFKIPPEAVKEKEEEVGELPVDVYETPGEIIIQTLIAGVLPENLSINITRDNVTISGRREENKTITKENYHYRELYWGAFTRSIQLPAEVEIDAAEAIERHGMLMIKLPKLDKARKANLKVKSI